MERARCDGDRTVLRQCAHEIRGASLNLGARRVAAAAEALDAPQVDGLDVTALDEHIATLREAILAFGHAMTTASRR